MESEHGKGSIEHVKKNPEVKYEDGKIFLEGKTPDFSSASSVSSSSSSSSSLQFDIGEKGPFDDSSAKSKFDGNSLSGPEYVSSPDTQTPQWSMLSASPPAGNGDHLSPELSTASPDSSIYNTASQLKSPPVQTMRQPAGYDPNRIPASIFSTKATNPSEWSVASNESLFSIHMGNNSFSQDNAILFGKSGELSRLDEWNKSHSFLPYVSEAKSNEFSSLPATLPPVIEVPAHEESSVTSGKVSRLEKADSHNRLKGDPGATMENHAKEKMAPAEVVHLPAATTNAPDFKGPLPAETTLTSSSTPRTSTSNPRLSDESGNSSSSFAFPVLVSDGGKTGSLKGVTEKPEKPQLQSQVSKATRKASMTRWFSWFSCWPRCC
ncbi:hypothetical protein Pfo_008877 [Paulownia fortunei]|nr:hypothetical protein Pfo_008877 [Paulownia fortunei]